MLTVSDNHIVLGGGGGASATPDYQTTATSKNLVNPADVRIGKYIATNGLTINSAAGWAMTGFMPVTAGQEYAFSGIRNRNELIFFTSASDTAILAGSFQSPVFPAVITAPAGATHVAFSLYPSTAQTYSNIQMELGDTVTGYDSRYGEYQAVDRAYLYPATESGLASVGITSDILTCAGRSIDGASVEVGLKVNRPITNTASAVVDYNGAYVNSKLIWGAGDDVSPYTLNGNIGSNHGWYKSTVAAAAHGKTDANIGEVWLSGAVEYVLMAVPNANSITFTGKLGNTQLLANGTLTRSGSTSISYTTSTFGQIYPSIKNHTRTLFVDGVQYDATADFSAHYSDTVTVVERYDIISKASLAQWIIDNPTLAAASPALYQGDAMASVANSYNIDVHGTVTTQNDFYAVEPLPVITGLMFTQTNKCVDTAGTITRYIPKLLPFTANSLDWDFANGVNMTTTAVSAQLDLTSARCDATGILADRSIERAGIVGVMSVGFLPVADAAVARRRAVAPWGMGYISTAKKMYLWAVRDVAKTSMAAGEYYSVAGYKAFTGQTPNRTSCYLVRNGSEWYLYADWHDVTLADAISLPAYLSGKSIATVESKSAMLKNSIVTGSVFVDVDTVGSSGYIICKII